jgi:hypothetical protein
VRLILLLVGIVTAGAVGITQGVFPLPTEMLQAVFARGGEQAQVKTINGNSVDAYNRAMPQILRGSRTEELGFHWSAVTLPPESFHSVSGFPVNVGTRGQSGFAPNATSQIRQSNLRVQDMATFGRNQSAWNGALGH